MLGMRDPSSLEKLNLVEDDSKSDDDEVEYVGEILLPKDILSLKSHPSTG